MFGLPSLSIGPSLFPDIGTVFKAPAPVKTSLPKTVSVPKGVKVTDIGAGAGGAAQGAIAGSAFGPIGTGVGAGLGFISGLFGKPSGGSSGMPSLTDALSKGLGSLGFSTTQTNNQTQAVDQSTGVSVTNILGGQPFGGTNLATGDFDVFKTISDVFAIRDAQAAVNTASGGVVSAASGVTTKEGKSILPLVLLASGGILLLYFLTGKGK